MTYSDQSSLQHYGIRGMEWGKKKKKPLLSGAASGAVSKAVYPIAQTAKRAVNTQTTKSMQKGAASGVISSAKRTAQESAKRINMSRSIQKGAASGAVNATKRSMQSVTTRFKMSNDIRQGVASNASNVAEEARQILDTKNRGPKTARLAKEGASSAIAAKATDAVKDITTVPGSTADKGVQMIAKLFGTKTSSVLKSATSKAVSSKTSTVDAKKKKPAREWQNR